MATLPTVGADEDTWGDELNAFLLTSFNADGSLRTVNETLIDWTLAEAFSVTAATRDANEVISSATVRRPDGSTGTFTTTTLDASGAINAYTVTHSNTGKTVTQAAVTRDAAGAVTSQPALVVS